MPAIKVNFLRKMMVKPEKSKEINHSKWYFQKVLHQTVQQNFVQISLVLFGFKLQVLQSDYFVNLVTVIRKGNQNCSVQISLLLVNSMVKQLLRTRNQVEPRQAIELPHQTKDYFGQVVLVSVQINLQMIIENFTQQQVIY